MPTFMVAAHEQPDVFASLVAALAPYPVIVHVDARVDVSPFAQTARLHPHVRLLDERIPIAWAGFSQCRASFALMQAAVNVTTPGDHIVNLTGTCYPLRPVDDLVEHLAASPGIQHIRYLRAADFPDVFDPQIEARHHRDSWIVPGGSHRARRLNRQIADLRSAVAGVRRGAEPRHGPQVYVGQPVWALTRECAVDVLAARTFAWDGFFRPVFAADEKYVHTLVAHSQWARTTVMGGVEHPACPDTPRMAPLHWIPRFIGRPVTDSDWPEIASSDAFFVRKVTLPASAGVLELLRQRVKDPRTCDLQVAQGELARTGASTRRSASTQHGSTPGEKIGHRH